MQFLVKSLFLWLVLLTASTACASSRFLSADPLGHAASMDLYSYCNGDPVNGLDPDGRYSSGFGSTSGTLDVSSLGPMQELTPDAAEAGVDQVSGSESAYEQRIDDIMAGGGVSMAQAEQEVAAQDFVSSNPAYQSQVLNLIPGVGGLKMLGEAATGTDLVTGQSISGEQRYLDANLGVIGLAGGISGPTDGFAADEAVGIAAEGGGPLTKWFNQAGIMPTFFSKTNPGSASWYSRPHSSGLLSLIHPNVSMQGPTPPNSCPHQPRKFFGSFTVNLLLTELRNATAPGSRLSLCCRAA